MNNYEKHALREFKAAGWVDENGKFNDEMQEMICMHVMKLLEVFADEGHSGMSAPYAIDLFSRIAKFEPLTPLTGEDWEWNDVSEMCQEPTWQNKRASNVFKNKHGAYNVDGIIFWEWYTDPKTGEKFKSHFTNRESRVPIKFPYIPTKEYREYKETKG